MWAAGGVSNDGLEWLAHEVTVAKSGDWKIVFEMVKDEHIRQTACFEGDICHPLDSVFDYRSQCRFG